MFKNPASFLIIISEKKIFKTFPNVWKTVLNIRIVPFSCRVQLINYKTIILTILKVIFLRKTYLYLGKVI